MLRERTRTRPYPKGRTWGLREPADSQFNPLLSKVFEATLGPPPAVPAHEKALMSANSSGPLIWSGVFPSPRHRDSTPVAEGPNPWKV